MSHQAVILVARQVLATCGAAASLVLLAGGCGALSLNPNADSASDEPPLATVMELNVRGVSENSYRLTNCTARLDARADSSYLRLYYKMTAAGGKKTSVRVGLSDVLSIAYFPAEFLLDGPRVHEFLWDVTRTHEGAFEADSGILAARGSITVVEFSLDEAQLQISGHFAIERATEFDFHLQETLTDTATAMGEFAFAGLVEIRQADAGLDFRD